MVQFRHEYWAATEIQRIWRGHLSVPVYQHAQRLRAEERRRDAAAQRIQTHYRYYLGRKLQYTVHRYELEMNMANVIRQAWRNYVAHKFGWAAQQYKLENDMAARLQRMYRFWKTRQVIQQHLRALKENYRANEIQRVYRGHRGRLRAQARRRELLEWESARKIQKAWKAWCARRMVRLARVHRLKSAAAVKIQARFRAYAQRQRYLHMLWEHKRELAALRIQCQYRIHRARQKLRRKLWIQRNGPCLKCEDELAQLYSIDFELELCETCFMDIVEIEHAFEAEQYDSDDSAASPFVPRQFHSMPIELYRRQTTEARRIQLAYRRKQLQFLFKYGRCHDCPKPKKVYCYDCNVRLCYTCSYILHEHGTFKHHRRVNNELFILHTQSAIVAQKQ